MNIASVGQPSGPPVTGGCPLDRASTRRKWSPPPPTARRHRWTPRFRGGGAAGQGRDTDAWPAGWGTRWPQTCRRFRCRSAVCGPQELPTHIEASGPDRLHAALPAAGLPPPTGDAGRVSAQRRLLYADGHSTVTSCRRQGMPGVCPHRGDCCTLTVTLLWSCR